MKRSGWWLGSAAVISALAAAPADAAVAKDGKNFSTRSCRCQQRQAAVAAGKDGAFMIGWHGRTPTELGAAVGRFFSADGTPQADAAAINAETRLSVEREVDLANHWASGRYVAAWMTGGVSENTDVYLRRYSSSGQPLGAAFPARTDDAAAPIAESFPSVAVGPDGGFAVAWLSRTLPGGTIEPGVASIQLRRFDAGGNALGPSQQINETLVAGRPHVCIDPTNSAAIVAWTGTKELRPFLQPEVGIKFRRVSSAGAFLGGETPVTPSVLSAPNVALSCAPAGGFVAVWETTLAPADKEGDVVAARYDKNGNKLGATFLVPSGRAGIERRPSVSHDSGSNFVVVWEDKTATSYTIEGRRFLANGKADGDDFEVIARPIEKWVITSPDIAHRGTKGDFVVAFEKAGLINGQRFTIEPVQPNP